MSNTGDSTSSAAPAYAAGADVVEFEESAPTVLRRLQQFLHDYPTIVPFVVLVIGIVFFSIVAGGRFLHPYNLSLVLQQVTIIGVIGMAQTLIILTAGIDLSVGAIMVLTSVVAGRTAVLYGFPTEVAFLIGLGCGLGCGAVNGILVAYLRLPPFIVTLGTWSIFGALNLWVSQSSTIRQQEVAEAAPALQFTGQAFSFLGARITMGSIIMVLLAIALWVMLNRTAFGRHIYAVGDAPESARLSGINVQRTLVAVYVIAGAICALAAWILIGRIGAISPTSGGTANLDSITAVVIGGTSLFGGRGSIIGTLIGALIVGVFRNGLALSGVDVLWQEFTVGVLVIVAVILDQWIRKVAS
jgi:fructose transport system permease protein